MDLVNKNWERTIMETWGADYCNDCNPKLDMRKKSGKNQPNKMGMCVEHIKVFLVGVDSMKTLDLANIEAFTR
jgi:hypothetical protein